MIHQELLRHAVIGRPPALVDFVETLAPRLLERFTTITALGGSGRPKPLTDPNLPEGLGRFTEEELSLFSERNPDQSLTAHILNGLFAGLRLAERLPPEKALTNWEQRLWVLGYIVHDYTKVYGIKVMAGQLDVIRKVIYQLGQDLSFETYLPDWLDYLEDIIFLAQNTQKVEGANLNLRDYQLKVHPRRLDVLRLLSSYADVLVHIKSPSDVLLQAADGRNTANNLRKTLADLFGAGQSPRLTYHKVSDVRGLLSNLVHNAMMAELKEQGYEPYLFFPNGVVYLANPEVEAKINPEGAANTVWQRVQEIVSESETFGVRRAGTGFIPSSALYELTGQAGVLAAGRRKAMGIASSKAAARLHGFFTGESESDLKRRLGDNAEQVKEAQTQTASKQGLPFDVRVDRLGEFLTMIYRTVRENFKRAPDVRPILLDAVGLGDQLTIEEATRQKGGTYFGWFYAASRYIHTHPGLDDNGVEDVMQDISEDVLAWVEQSGLEARTGKGLAEVVKMYVVAQLEVDGNKPNRNGDLRTTFAYELNRYMIAKAERKPLCSLCSSSYEAVEQEATEVPFVNQQYSNKNPLDVTKLKRGVCPVCRIEMILRLVQQEGVSEDRRPIQLYLYPTYFFTLETERVAKSFLAEMADLNVFALRQHLRTEELSLRTFLHFDGFLGDPNRPRRGIRTPGYREDEQAGLVFASLIPLGRNPTDTDTWVIPTLLAIGIPLLLDVKVVATPSFVPLFPSGADFRETAVLDSPHAFTNHVWGRVRFRVDELEEALIKLLALYDLHLDVFAEGYDPHWPQLNAVAKDIATDPYYVFGYYERKERGRQGQRRKKKGGRQPTFKGIPSQELERYLEIYNTLGGETDMGIIGKLVDAYAAFYRARKLDAAYAVLRPLGTATDVIVKSDPRTGRDDLLLLVAGAVNDDIDRVRADQAEGWIPLKTESPEQQWFPLLRQKIEEFSRLCVDDLLYGYCQGDRAMLRERLNRLRSAARFYYLQKYSYQS
jgi:CRISPR-associated protein Csc3